MSKNCKYTSIGGQALIEGILMKNADKSALAVRLPDSTIEVCPFKEKSIKSKCSLFKLPVIRGVIGYIEAMLNGYKAMMLSADKSGFADEVDEKGETKKMSAALFNAVMAVAGVLALALSVILFMYLPRLCVAGLNLLFGRTFSPFINSLIEQSIKLIVFVGYILIVSFTKDIKRVFAYHGAEHKTIFCYEKGLPLTVDNARKQKRFHPRCGTSFMILMIIISIIFSTLAQAVFKDVYSNMWVWTAIKILMIPLICGVGYEVLKLCGKYDNILTRIISAPGMWVQRITTKEPDDSMLEVAISALEAVLDDKEKLEEKLEENDNI